MAENNLELARFNMIEQQIRPWNVPDDRVLEQMQSVPREQFVPAKYRNLAFADTELPIGEGQRTLAPKVEAHMLQALDIKPQERALEVGTGCGYLTACLAKLAAKVISVDIHAPLTALAAEHLRQQNINNVELRTADALAAPTNGGPFDVIAVGGSIPTIKQIRVLKQQLRVGGRMVVFVGEAPLMEMMLITRSSENHFEAETLMEIEIDPLENAPVPEHFTF